MRSTKDKKSPTYVLKLHVCPACKETIFAAEGATFSQFVVVFRWHCDLCGHRFETAEPLGQVAA